MSQALSARARQPGHERGWTANEAAVASAVRSLLPDRYDVIEQPDDLRSFYGPWGLVPELRITNRDTGRYLYVEVKRQGAAGNAEERVYKYFTVPFIDAVADRSGLGYHPFVAVFCDALATEERYRRKLAAHLPEGTYLFWVDEDPGLLAGFLDELRSRHLEDGPVTDPCRDRTHLLAPNPSPARPAQVSLFEQL